MEGQETTAVFQKQTEQGSLKVEAVNQQPQNAQSPKSSKGTVLVRGLNDLHEPENSEPLNRTLIPHITKTLSPEHQTQAIHQEATPWTLPPLPFMLPSVEESAKQAREKAAERTNNYSQPQVPTTELTHEYITSLIKAAKSPENDPRERSLAINILSLHGSEKEVKALLGTLLTETKEDIPNDLLTAAAEVVNPEDVFPDRLMRKDVYTISKNLVEYIRVNNIKRLILIDTAARPAYVGLVEYFNLVYPKETKPEIYFINPTGFLEQDETGLSPGAQKAIEKEKFKFEKYARDAEENVIVRTREEIDREFQETYRELMRDKGASTLVFDNCIHTASSIQPTLEALNRAGLTRVQVGVASNRKNESGIIPDFVAIDGEPAGACYPFHKDRIVKKTFLSSHSLHHDPEVKQYGTQIREGIKQIIRENVEQERSRVSTSKTASETTLQEQ